MKPVTLKSSSYGANIEFALVPFSSKALAAVCAGLGAVFVWVGTTERAAVKNVQWLAWGLGLFFVVLALLIFLQRYRQRQNPYVAVIGALRYTWRPANQSTGKRFEIDLGEVTRTLWLVDKYHRRLMVESHGKVLSLFGGWKLPEGDEARFIAALERRAGLCRAGVDSRDEMGAAEAYLAESEAGRKPVAIAIKRENKKRVYRSVTAADEIQEAVKQGFTVYVPERAHQVLAESIGPVLCPLRGVD